MQNARMEAVQSPIIPVVGELIRQNPGTISLGQGVVYYPPPQEALEMLPQFLADPDLHKYQAVTGIAPLRGAIATKLQTENNIEIGDRNAVVVTAGSNMAFLNAILAIASFGDEIILQTPYYFNHEMAIAIAGCRAVCVETDGNYQLRLEAIAAAITPKTRAIVTISPNNPTGAVYPAKDLQAVNDLCRDRGLYHIHDEAYEYFTYDGAKSVSPASFRGSCDYTISLFSLSKAYGFASWRIGYMVIPQHLLDPVKKIQDTNLICASVVSQYAALGALQVGKAYCQQHLGAIASVRQTLLQALHPLADRCIVPTANGAFYLFLKLNSNLDAFTVVKRLIREYGVAVIPGTTFGITTGCYLRVAYGALQQETTREGIERLTQGLKGILA